jgi:hypothetical protein
LTSEEIFEGLKSLASEMGIKIRFETGNFEGGYCLLREEKMLVINRRTTVPKKNKTLALGLHEYGLDNIFITPALRAAIDDEVAKALQENRLAA